MRTHWQSGEIRSGDKWASVDATVKQDGHSAKLDEYRQGCAIKRQQTVDDQIKLARWCEKAELKEQQRVHLTCVLQLQPNNKEAISKLGLVRFRGQLMPTAELEKAKTQVRDLFAESKEWKARIADWRQQLQNAKAAEREEVLKQILAVRDPRAIPGMEQKLEPLGKEASLAVVDAFADMPQQSATESLLRIAVFSQFDEVRSEAVYALKKRSLYSYVPILLSALRMPIQVQYEAHQFDRYSFAQQMVFYRRGADQDDEYINSQTTHLTSAPPRSLNHPGYDRAADMVQSIKRQQVSTANAAVQNVDRLNQQSATFNGVLARFCKKLQERI